MNCFWTDREGNSAPFNCTFHFTPFSSQKITSFPSKQVLLPPPTSSKVLKASYLPDYKNWKKGVELAVQKIREKKLEKIVLARICVLQLAENPSPLGLTAALKERSQGAFVYCFQLGQKAFLGASPERLFRREKSQIWSEAMAGTRARGKDQKEDLLLQEELLNSAKDVKEFLPVEQYLEQTLSPLCKTSLCFSPLSIHKTYHVQHLRRTCSAQLKESIRDQDILHSLHPTPALCGTPKTKAHSLIRKIEPFERSLYGGAIGWSTPHHAEWIVAIRSCLIEGNQAVLFSGTGIVEDSDPEQEWEELNQKLKLYASIFQGF